MKIMQAPFSNDLGLACFFGLFAAFAGVGISIRRDVHVHQMFWLVSAANHQSGEQERTYREILDFDH
jgi:hypothetical protein